MALTDANGIVCLLDHERTETKAFALNKLNDIVDEFWAEISDSVGKIETLYEDNSFTHNKLAALLASKVYYHLAAYDDALHFALCAEELFDLQIFSQYVDTITSRCIDKYIELRVAQESSDADHHTSTSSRTWAPSSPTYMRLEQLVNTMFDRCFEHRQYKDALGIAIESRRLDIFEKVLKQADDKEEILRYAYRVIMRLIDNASLRKRLLTILVKLYDRASTTDAINLCQCLVLLDDPQQTAQTLQDLLQNSDESTVTAYQVAFDLYENSSQIFLQRTINCMTRSSTLGHLMRLVNAERNSDIKPKPTQATTVADRPPTPMVAETPSDSAAVDMDQELGQLSPSDLTTKNKLANLIAILSGDKVIELHLQFLIRNNKADLRLLERIRDEVRHTVMHNATVLANGIMHCGTTSDQFLRDHLNWLGKAVNWAKFTATATLGVIHKGHEKEALRLMSAYLPKDSTGSSGSVYTEGGGLFALGLIHANHGGQMTDYLLRKLSEATAEPVRHGACLGLGLAAMGTGRNDIYEELKNNLYQDDAVTGEAAGIAIGLVMLGSGSESVIQDLVRYAQDTSHEKIVRGIALAIALIMYGRLEEADTLIDTLLADNNPILRWAGTTTIAMAYCGSGNNHAVERLLHTAVSDTNDDVRRWSVTSLGFILFKTPEKVPPLVSLLAESYHPHIRYGAAMAVGIACAGTAMKEAASILQTLYEGSVPFVRQGALLASAMVMIQQNGVTMPKSVEFREKVLKIIGDRHEDLMTKLGAILACGILDAGGCNMTISMQTVTGNNNVAAAVGLLIFQNFWFWYPLTNFISLAFTPTTLITLNKDLKMPAMQFCSNAKPSTFAYPQPLQPEKEKKREKVETAVLSITAKQRKKDADKKWKSMQQQKGALAATASTSHKEEKMDVDPDPKATATTEEKAYVEPKVDKEVNQLMLNNPARVMRAQQRFISLPDQSRYYTIKPITQGGILMVVDRKPQEKETCVELVPGHGPTSGGTDSEQTGGGQRDGSSTLSSAAQGGSKFHASTIGAHFDDDDEEGEDEMEEDDDAEMPLIESVKPSSSSQVKEEPGPPEPFVYIDEDSKTPPKPKSDEDIEKEDEDK